MAVVVVEVAALEAALEAVVEIEEAVVEEAVDLVVEEVEHQEVELHL